MTLKRFSFALILFLFGYTICFTACKETPKTIEQTVVNFKKEGELSIYKQATDSVLVALEIEIADTDYEIQTGLMYRDNMKPNRGMLFVFEDVSPRYFYMKNTRFALDLIFVDDENKIVSFQKNAKPFDETSLPSNAPAKYVLEVNAGQVDVWGVSVGDYIKY